MQISQHAGAPDLAAPRHPRADRRHLRRTAALVVCCGVWALLAAGAQEPLSPPLGAPISPSIYSESQQAGPSTSLIPGDNSLTNPALRQGISDPLGFLIETGEMSPFAFTSVDTGTSNGVQQPILNDPILALKYSEYRNNRLLMTGAGSRSQPMGRQTAAGAARSNRFAVVAAPRNSFAGVSLLQPFAAGSSLGSDSVTGLLDPNRVAGLDATTLSLVSSGGSEAYALGSAEPPLDASATGGSISPLTAPNPASGMDSLGVASAGSGSVAGLQSGLGTGSLPAGALDAIPGAAVSSRVPSYGSGADAMPVGPLPGQVFPDFGSLTSSRTGFADSTMGTTSQMAADDTIAGISPLDSKQFSGLYSPFRDLNEASATGALSPTLYGAPLALGRRSHTSQPLSLADTEKIIRKQRMQAVAEGRQVKLPTVFALRSMQRAYITEHREGRSRRPSLLVPSVTPSTTQPTTY